eukprot:TRINITY_DN82215_c0_g1_i1.p1 TRINITY_DN82215_c0_g1~~TRINITY_DN82215_c0_g1_i1.p1  ORF type:complete len:522 (+),score=65.78 TRINITY_DN82215_c0_g1_i1:254-1819(+)
MAVEELNIALQRIQGSWVALKVCPRELWLVYLLKLLESYGHFSFSITFTLFITDEFGYSDEEAGVAYGLSGALTSGFGLVIGFAIDNWGVRKSLIIGFAVLLVARVLLFLTSSFAVLRFCIYILLPMGQAMGIPVLATGIRRYTTEENRGFAFGVFYAAMNIAALLSGWIVDFLTLAFQFPKRRSSADRAFLPFMTTNRMVLLTGAMTTGVALVVAVFFVREIKVSSSGQQPQSTDLQLHEDDDSRDGVVEGKQAFETFTPSRASALKIVRELLTTATFWRYLVFVLLTVNLKVVFRHLDATLPKYLVREFGEDVPKGSIYSINPFLIIGLVPVVTALTQHRAHYDMIRDGSWVTALSVLPMALSTSIPSVISFVVLLSVGEAFWSPRIYDYTVSVAPEGREGTFMSLASAPIFVAMLPVGWLSGHLLARYCPADPGDGTGTAERNSQVMWLIIGVLTLTSPVLLFSLERWVREPHRAHEEDREFGTAVVVGPDHIKMKRHHRLVEVVGNKFEDADPEDDA